ncbi:MAG TPA: hypothetical protein VMX57_03025, partial [Planctomycetota bacterium]|nr:hypothetical protein [Planctomycetota bacterium]
HRFWAFMAIPMAMVAGEFLQFVSSGLSGRYTVLAVSLGAVLGLAMGLGGLCEAVYAMEPATVQGLRSLAFVLALLASVAGVVTALYLLVQHGEPQRTWWRFAGVVALVTGIALTSGFVKTRFQGFTGWDPGVTFYAHPVYYVRAEDGQMQLATSESSNDLWGYVILKHASVPNLPVLGLTASDRQIIGFDLGTPPFNEQVRQLREEVSMTMDRAVEIQQEATARLAERGLPQAEAEGIRRRSAARMGELADGLVARIYSLAVANRFPLVTIDYSWAARAAHWRLSEQATRIQLLQKAKITSVEHLEELLRDEAAPTPLEAEYLDEIRAASQRIQQALNDELKAAAKVQLLRSFLDASPLFKRRDITAEQPDGSMPDLSRFGITVFSVEEKPAEQPAE